MKPTTFGAYETIDTKATNGLTVHSYEASADLNLDETESIDKSLYYLDHTSARRAQVCEGHGWPHSQITSTKCVTDEAGLVEVSYVYRAFGEQLKKLGEGEATYTYGVYEPDEQEAMRSIDFDQRSKLRKELDVDTNLYYSNEELFLCMDVYKNNSTPIAARMYMDVHSYFNARYYDATIGRFINVDPGSIPEQHAKRATRAIQDGTNWYTYCNNNPMSYVDPTGLDYFTDIIMNLFGAMFGQHHDPYEDVIYPTIEKSTELAIEGAEKFMDPYYRGQYFTGTIDTTKQNLWRATGIETSVGATYTLPSGITVMGGTSSVTFENLNTGEEITHEYLYYIKDQKGMNVSFGGGAGAFEAFCAIDNDATEDDIINSWYGSFTVKSAGVSFVGGSSFETTSNYDDWDTNGKWKGWSLGASKGRSLLGANLTISEAIYVENPIINEESDE